MEYFVEDFVEASSMEASTKVFLNILTASVKVFSTSVFVKNFVEAFLEGS